MLPLLLPLLPAGAASGEEKYITLGQTAANHLNPLGRASMQRPDAHTLARASVISVSVGAAVSAHFFGVGGDDSGLL